MHVGIICQLNYHGGGLLQYQVGNESSQIVFTQSPFLRVGQRVSFIQRCVRGTAEAVDIQRLASHEGLDAENLEQSKVSLHSEDMRRKDISTVSTVDRPQHCEAVGLRAEAAGSMQWKDGEQNVNHTVAKRKEIDASSSARDGRVLSQTRRLQRSIGVFHNADSQERLAMVKEAEDVLQHLLEEPEIDGDGICKLVRRCVGWLHVPIPFDRPTVANNQDLSTDEMNLEEHHSEHSNLQARVRRLLILALNALDLTDAVTFQAVEEALNYIRILLQQAERSGFEARPARSKQWRKLSLLVKRDYLKRKDRASSVNDIFQPNRKVMNLPLVFKSSEEVPEFLKELQQQSWERPAPAEDVLQHLLEEPEIDGDGICKLVRRCVGWLHVPISSDRPAVANNQDLNTDEMNPEERPSEHSNLQARVRRLLILALNALDLTDAVTFQAVEEALNYIRILLQQAERSGFEARPARSKQWRKLSLLVEQRDSLKRKDLDLRAEAAGSMQWKDGEQQVNHTVAKRKEIDASSSARDGPVLSQTRRLQRSIGVFHNADSQERLDMVKKAEDILQQLLEEPEIDGDGICKLVRRCVGWLHVPIPSDRPAVAKNQDLNTHEVNFEEHASEHSNLQARVRRLLILALNALDLTDAVTFQAVEEALNYIRILLQQAERSHHGNASALKQWARLEALVTPTDFGKAEKHRVLRMAHKDKGTVVDGSYTPNRKVRDLPMVFESDDIVELECSKCSHVICSSWFWRHTGTGRLHVVVPKNGHRVCTTKLGKKCPWIVRGEMPPKNDHINELDLCPHHREKKFCKDCGGSHICVHLRQRQSCKLCKRPRKSKMAPVL
eukprot:symbB.v1.2.024955.t1/scaffold2364.1/size162346/2